MSVKFQYRLWHLFVAVALFSLVALVASLLEWNQASWLRNCFVLAFFACGELIVFGLLYVLATNLRWRRSRDLPAEITHQSAERSRKKKRRVRRSTDKLRETSGFKW